MKIRLKDIILLAFVVIAAAVWLTVLGTSRQDGAFIEISVDGKAVASLPLDRDAEYDTGNGNTVCVSGGSAYMKTADCPGGDCLHHKPVSSAGEIIVCLPNRVTVTVKGKASMPDVDAVVG